VRSGTRLSLALREPPHRKYQLIKQNVPILRGDDFRVGEYAMEILTVFAVLQLLLLMSVGSLLRAFFIRGCHRGIQEAAAEIIRGVDSHFEAMGKLPSGVSKALETLKTAPGNVSHRKQLDRRYAQLWIFGDAIGSACWSKGYLLGKQTMAPRDGKILVEISLTELLQLNWLAHLGFQYMMPNYRGFETHRFSGEYDARDAAKAVERLEVSIPATHRPVDPTALSNGRLALIESWWSERKLVAV
jgi:hypothetical protein